MKTPFILDTDIGPDCDDAGALAMVNELHNAGILNLLCVTHCTTNPYGCGCIDAVNRFYGNRVPVGTLQRDFFLDGGECRRYNKTLCETYDNDYMNRPAPPAVRVLRETLAASPDASVVIAAIGPLPNLYDLLHSEGDDVSELPGCALISKKVRRLVVMGGGFAAPEYNFFSDAAAASFLCARWPGEIWFSTFEVGEPIITGRSFPGMAENNPVRLAYRLHSPRGRNSWDQTAVYTAALGPLPYFKLSPPGRMQADAETGSSTWTESSTGLHRLVLRDRDTQIIAAAIDRIMCGDLSDVECAADRLE